MYWAVGILCLWLKTCAAGPGLDSCCTCPWLRWLQVDFCAWAASTTAAFPAAARQPRPQDT